MGLEECVLVDLQTLSDNRGDLTIVEGGRHVPFEIRRVYFLHGVPAGISRGGHAHKRLRQLFVAASGGFDVLLDDAFARKTVRLDRVDRGLIITPMIWRELRNFSPGSVCMVLASEHYDEDDYFRDYTDFSKAVGRR